MFHWKSRPPGRSTDDSKAVGADRQADDIVQATVTEPAPCQKSLRLRVGRRAIEPVRSAVLAEFQKHAALPGFRKGKAPLPLVERQHAKAIHEETIQRVTQQTLAQVAEAHQLKPVGPFELTAARFSEAEGLLLEATVEVEPSFALADYRGIPLTTPSTAVAPEDVERAVGQLRESMAHLAPAGEGQAKERQLPPLDDELAKDVGFQTLAALREHLKAKLREQRRLAAEQAVEAALCEELLRRHPFDVPPRLVSRQTERLTREFTARLLLSGVPEEQSGQETSKFAEQLRTSATRHVRLAFILDRIAAQEALTVTQDELVGRLWQLAQRSRKDPAEVRKRFDEQGLWPSVLSAIRQEKTISLLRRAAQMTSVTSEPPVTSETSERQ